MIHKILVYQACGILTVPCWKRCLWFTVLGEIAVKWIDIPHNALFFQSVHGRPLRQKPGLTVRAVVFNAYGYLANAKDSWPWDDLGVQADNVEGIGTLRQLLTQEEERPESLSLQQCKALSQADPVLVRIVIESTEEHP